MPLAPNTVLSVMLYASVMATAAGGHRVQAQQSAPPATPPRPMTADGQAAPPVIAFPAQGITLEEAVRLTLQHDPVLKRRQLGAQSAQGLVQELRGLFDFTLTGTAEYTHRAQELSDGVRQGQQETRDTLQEFLDENREFLDNGQRLQPLLEQLRATPPGGLPLDDITRINPALGSTLSLLDQLILTETDTAARDALLATRNSLLDDISVDLATDISALELEFAAAEEELRKLGDTPRDEVFVDANAAFRLTKLFRSGLFVSPFLDAEYQRTNFKGKPRAAEFGGKEAPDTMRFRAGADFRLPLLRGRGALGTASAERAAAFDAEAAALLADHEASNRALATVEAYWNLRVAQEVVEITTVSLQFQDQVLAATRQLIAAQQVAAVEEARILAARSRVQSQLEDAQRQLVEARVALADVMGVAVSADPTSLPRAAEAFPQVPAEAPAVAALVEQAVGRRLDVSAAIKADEAGEVIAAGARRNLASQLDVSGGAWFTSLGEGSGKNALDRWVGPSGRVGLDYEKPLGNNRQEGQLLQAEAEAAGRRISRLEAERQVGLGVIEAAGSLQQAAARVEQAQAAVGHYDRTIESMLRLLNTGNVRLIDTLTTQQQQNDARLAVVFAQLELARRLARLRYQTGSLLSGTTLTPRGPAAGGSERD